MNKLLIFIASFLKQQNFPHTFKYLFYLLLNEKKIFVDRMVDISKSKMKLNIGNFIEYWIYMDGIYERDWIRNVIPFIEGRVLIDVGSNVGIYPLVLHKKARFIYAFEPERENYRRLIDNLKRNNINNVEVINKAVSDQTKKASLFISNDSGSHSLLLHSNGKIEKVSVITLDGFLFKRKRLDVGLVKIDVEGAEFDVLRGATRLIKKYRPALLIEFNSAIAKTCGVNLFEMYEYLTDRGYAAHRLHDTRLKKISRFEIDNIYNENLLFLWKGN